MRPNSNQLFAAMRRPWPAAGLACPAALLVLSMLYLAAQLFGAEHGEPRRLEFVEPLAPLPPVAADQATSPDGQFSAQQVQHHIVARPAVDVPSYLRHDDACLEEIAPGGTAPDVAAPRVVYEHNVIDRPSIQVPLLVPPQTSAAVAPAAPPAADVLPPLPGGPALTPAKEERMQIPSYQSVLHDRLRQQQAAISPYPAVRGHVSPQRPELSPKVIAASPQPSQPPAPAAPVRCVEQQEAASPPESGTRMVASQADRHVREAFTLAQRGALFSARAELIQALRLVTQSLDAAQATNRHSTALAAGLRALEESEDFIPRGTQLEADLDMAALIASHRTPVFKNTDGESLDLATLTPLVAVQKYLLYAQQQLIAACEGTPAGSLSLYGLGRLHMALADLSAESPQRRHPQAMTLYQAAVATDNGNFLAANELGVMLARYGRHAAAKEMLQLASRGQARAETWHNLAAVHQQLGEQQLAALARQEFQAAKARQNGALRFASRNGLSAPVVDWVSPEAFAAQSPAPASPAQARQPQPAKPDTAKPQEKAAGVTGWLNTWNTRKR